MHKRGTSVHCLLKQPLSKKPTVQDVPDEIFIRNSEDRPLVWRVNLNTFNALLKFATLWLIQTQKLEMMLAKSVTTYLFSNLCLLFPLNQAYFQACFCPGFCS